jgi:hypothetical protein
MKFIPTVAISDEISIHDQHAHTEADRRAGQQRRRNAQ